MEHVARAAGVRWSSHPPDVEVPQAVTDLLVSQDFNVADANDVWFGHGWWLPGADEMPEFVAPTDDELDEYRRG